MSLASPPKNGGLSPYIFLSGSKSSAPSVLEQGPQSQCVDHPPGPHAVCVHGSWGAALLPWCRTGEQMPLSALHGSGGPLMSLPRQDEWVIRQASQGQQGPFKLSHNTHKHGRERRERQPRCYHQHVKIPHEQIKAHDENNRICRQGT